MKKMFGLGVMINLNRQDMTSVICLPLLISCIFDSLESYSFSTPFD